MKILNKIKNFDKKVIVKKVGLGLALVTLVGLISAVAVNLNAHDCKLTKNYCYDSTSHYYECTVNKWCNKKFQEEEHELNWVIDREETIFQNGIKHRECECGYRINTGTVIDNYTYDNSISQSKDLTSTSINLTEDRTLESTISTSYGYFANENNRNVNFNARSTIYPDSKYLIENQVQKFIFSFNVYAINGNAQEFKLYFSSRESTYYLNVFGTEYRSAKLSELGADFFNSKYIDVDFGVHNVDGIGIVFGFRLKTENCTLTFLSDNTGNVKDSEIVSATDWIKVSGIYNSKTENTAVDLYENTHGYTPLAPTRLNCSKGSVWFEQEINRIMFNKMK